MGIDLNTVDYRVAKLNDRYTGGLYRQSFPFASLCVFFIDVIGYNNLITPDVLTPYILEI